MCGVGRRLEVRKRTKQAIWILTMLATNQMDV